MAQNSHTTCAFFLIALIMFATAKPLAHSLVGGLLDPGLVDVLRSSKPVPIANVPQSALDLLPLVVKGLTVEGVFCCTATGKCLETGGQPLSGALVNLNCTSNQLAGGSLVIGQNRIDINGYFNISVTNIVDIIHNLFPLPMPCNITVQLDRADCPQLLSAADGALVTVLTAVVRPLSLVLNPVLGLICSLVICLTAR